MTMDDEEIPDLGRRSARRPELERMLRWWVETNPFFAGGHRAIPVPEIEPVRPEPGGPNWRVVGWRQADLTEAGVRLALNAAVRRMQAEFDVLADPDH